MLLAAWSVEARSADDEVQIYLLEFLSASACPSLYSDNCVSNDLPDVSFLS